MRWEYISVRKVGRCGRRLGRRGLGRVEKTFRGLARGEKFGAQWGGFLMREWERGSGPGVEKVSWEGDGRTAGSDVPFPKFNVYVQWLSRILGFGGR